MTPRRFVVEIRTSDAAQYALGDEITATAFEAGQTVDVVGRTKGKGTAGRHEEARLPRHEFLARRAPQTTASLVSIRGLRHAEPGVQRAC